PLLRCILLVSQLDFTALTFTLLANSVPVFWLGLLMLALFYARLQWSAGPGRLDDIYQLTIEPRRGVGVGGGGGGGGGGGRGG
ncbi:hypothetical protein NQU33_26320, partial [Escherichia coli]|nr:hypothetical protein [Escherichia coli]